MIKEAKVSASYRIPIAGGGTDIPEIFSLMGGRLISAAIDKRLEVELKVRDDNIVKISFEVSEKVSKQVYDIDSVQGLIGCILNNYKKTGLDILIRSDIKGHSGMGGSGTLGVCLVAGLNALNGIKSSPYDIAFKAYKIEREEYGTPIGYQDQMIAAYGGLIEMEISKEGNVKVEKLDSAIEFNLNKIFRENALMVNVNKQRIAKNVLQELTKEVSQKNKKTLKGMREISGLLPMIKTAIINDDVKTYGQLLNKHWEIKRGLATSITNNHIDNLYSQLMNLNSYGGKLMGAGGGGYILAIFDKDELHVAQKKLEALGYECLRVSCRNEGVTLER